MRFKVLKSFAEVPSGARNVCYLIHTDWDDWYEFASEYILHHYDLNGVHTIVGQVKVGVAQMQGMTTESYCRLLADGADVTNVRVPTLPSDYFAALPENYFSLGTADSYYEFLGKDAERQKVLEALRDMAYDLEILRANEQERVVVVSLFRGISKSRVENRFAKLAHNEAVLTDFEFQYEYPYLEGVDPVVLDWKISVESFPPSNIKVIVGRNGVGKTHLLRNIVLALCEDTETDNAANEGGHGRLEITEGSVYGVVFASLSPFEEFSFGKLRQDMSLNAVGCVKTKVELTKTSVVKNDDLSTAFTQALCSCRQEPCRSRWLRAIAILKSDPMFNRLEGEALLGLSEEQMQDEAGVFFKKLSSGHAAMMLLVTQLVCVLDEKFLVLLDEPESHLHPPLLAAFVRCLSYLLRERNAVCLIATHSPVVLQEVSRDSVWILNRSGRRIDASRPTIETFGENINILMHEVFGLEMTSSGFHKLLADIVNQDNSTYEQILSRFQERLSVEARALLRIMITHRDTVYREGCDA